VRGEGVRARFPHTKRCWLATPRNKILALIAAVLVGPHCNISIAQEMLLRLYSKRCTGSE